MVPGDTFNVVTLISALCGDGYQLTLLVRFFNQWTVWKGVPGDTFNVVTLISKLCGDGYQLTLLVWLINHWTMLGGGVDR